jgi:hypothetical protein
MNPQEAAVLAAWVEAIATTVAVLAALAIAIFQDSMRAWFRRPKLDVSIALEPPDCHMTKMRKTYQAGGVSTMNVPADFFPQPSEADVYYLRLRVANKGRKTASQVEVFAHKLERKRADGSFSEVDTFIPMNLQWSYHRLLFFPEISPSTYKHCDLAHVVDPHKRADFPMETPTELDIPAYRTVLSFDTKVKPFTRSYIVPEGVYRLTIIVAAADIQPVTKELEITLTGDWHSDERKMFSEGIGITVL